ncbi:hypothetical protein ACWJJH_01125 [Endozoicomonadaceae bacterium StTr2]
MILLHAIAVTLLLCSGGQVYARAATKAYPAKYPACQSSSEANRVFNKPLLFFPALVPVQMPSKGGRSPSDQGEPPALNEQQPAGATSQLPPPPSFTTVVTEHPGSRILHFQASLGRLKILLEKGETVIVIADIDKTIHFCEAELPVTVEPSQFLSDQFILIGVLNQWLSSLSPDELDHLLMIWNTARKITDNPETTSGLLVINGEWPSDLLSGLPNPAILISNHGHDIRIFQRPFCWTALKHFCLDAVRPPWPLRPIISIRELDTALKPVLQEATIIGYAQGAIIVDKYYPEPDERKVNSVASLHHIISQAGARVEHIQNQDYHDESLLIYDPLTNKGTALFRVLSQLLKQGIIDIKRLNFVCAGDDLPDLTMLLPKEFIVNINQDGRHQSDQGYLLSMFNDFMEPYRLCIRAWHGSVISATASPAMHSAISKKAADSSKQRIRYAEQLGLDHIFSNMIELLNCPTEYDEQSL